MFGEALETRDGAWATYIFLAARGKLFARKVEGLVSMVCADELNEALLLEMEVEPGVRIKNLGVEVVDEADCALHVPRLHRAPNLHPLLNARQLKLGRHPSLGHKPLGDMLRNRTIEQLDTLRAALPAWRRTLYPSMTR